MKNVKLGWYLITKRFQGGGDYYAIRLTNYIRDNFESWDDFLEYIGENTGGGHHYGYKIDASYKKKKPTLFKGEKVKALRLKSVMIEKLVVGK